MPYFTHYNAPYVRKLYVVWSIVLVAGKALSYRYHCCEIQPNCVLDGFAFDVIVRITASLDRLGFQSYKLIISFLSEGTDKQL